MKKKMSQSIKIPEGISCIYTDKVLSCRNGSIEVRREIKEPQINVKVEDSTISLTCEKGNKNHYKKILSYVAHIENMFKGLKNKFVYKLESVNVHFPMTFKIDKGLLVISNFLGEKVPRHAKIMPNVEVEIKGQNITISSIDREAAGQTAANFEKAAKVRNKDRRIFQDGIYITEKPRRENV